MENNLSGRNLLNVLLKRKVHIAIITLVGLIIGVIFSGPKFIIPKFKSTAIVFPSNIQPYSEESETEQLVQWFNSDNVKFEIIEKYNLYDHYKIKKGSPKYQTYMLKEYNGNIKIEQTSNQAVKIIVLDKDPQLACDIANSIIEITNRNIDSTHKYLFGEVVKTYEKTLKEQNARIENLGSELIEYDKNGSVLKKIFSGSGNNAQDTITSDYIAKFFKLKSFNAGLEEFIYDYSRVLSEYNREFTHYSLVQAPYPADKKSYPIRWLIVLAAGVVMFFVSYAIFIVLDSNSEKTKKEA